MPGVVVVGVVKASVNCAYLAWFIFPAVLCAILPLNDYSASNLNRPLLWSVVIENVFSCKMVSIVVIKLLLAKSVYLSLLSICRSLKLISQPINKITSSNTTGGES